MLSPALQQVLFGSNFYPGTTVALDFLAQRYRAPGVGNFISNFGSLPGLTVTRASVGYAGTASGGLMLFQANVARITDLGLLVEEARTNVALWNRDLTNAAWTKTSITAALDQTGADGGVNSASSLTATGANGTVLQAITLASSARFQSAWVKRITGSGVIQMTMDNGVTWTAITVTAAYTQLTIPTQTLANPTVGFRIVTSGDAIAVDFVQNENGASPTSPIPATSASATRAADVITLSASLSGAYTLLSKSTRAVAVAGASQGIFEGNDGTTTNLVRFRYRNAASNFSVQVTTANVSQWAALAGTETGAGTVQTVGVSLSANNGLAYANGTQIASTATLSVPSLTTLRLGSESSGGAFLNGYIQTLLAYPRNLTAAEMGAATQ